MPNWRRRPFLCPGRDRLSGLLRLRAADRKALSDDRPLADAPQVAFAHAHAAALVGAEGRDLLARKVKRLQKGEYRHGHGSPPVGIAQKNHVTAVQALGQLFQRGARVGALFRLCLLNTGIIVRGVLPDGFQFKQIAADRLLNVLRRNGGVAPGKVFDRSIPVIFALARKLDDEMHKFPPNVISHQVYHGAAAL